MNKHYILLIASFIAIAAIVFGHKARHLQQTVVSDDQDIIQFLQQYVRINTAHPNPDYKSAINFLKQHAQADGFEYQEIALPSGNSAVVITYQGTDNSLPGLALNHHIDVVPATDTHEWISKPFAAEIHNDAIIGRGVQDMKGIGAIHYYALKKLKNKGMIPKRTIHLFAVPDEEKGGFKGTKEFVQTDAFKKLNIGFVIDEGCASGSDQHLLIKVAERRPMQIHVTAKGKASHGSHLLCSNSNHELVQFLNGMVTEQKKQQQKSQTIQPGQLLSLNITYLQAGSNATFNVVPEKAEAMIDIRIPPTMSFQEVREFLDEQLKAFPTISYEIKAMATEESKPISEQAPLYKALQTTCQKFGSQTEPHYFEASSDLRFYRSLGIEGVGFTPFTTPDNIHGTNETLPISDLIRGKEIMVNFLQSFCL